MKTPDQLEKDSAWHILDVVMDEAAENCANEEDWDAAAMAILTKTIELITKKEMEICYKKNSSI